ncbi:MAG: cytochrome c [Acetobacteraceae bacterium]|nr:cytochrome c [Acetobacteraceae bacterium]
MKSSALRSVVTLALNVAALAALFLAVRGQPAWSAAPEPTTATQAARGQQLAETSGCAGCHSPPNGPALSGNMVGAWLAPNITPDPVSGIGAWSRAEIVQYLHTGSVPSRSRAAGPMAQVVEALQTASNADLDALAAWLMSQPPVRDPADQVAASSRGGPLGEEWQDAGLRGPQPASQDAMRIGARLFSGSCTTCHQSNGAGTPDGYFPSLFHNSAVGRRNPANLLAVLLNGVQRTAAGHSILMPGFDGSVEMPGGLSDAELAAIANFILAQFGDPASAKVTVTDIAASRAGR